MRKELEQGILEAKSLLDEILVLREHRSDQCRKLSDLASAYMFGTRESEEDLKKFFSAENITESLCALSVDFIERTRNEVRPTIMMKRLKEWKDIFNKYDDEHEVEESLKSRTLKHEIRQGWHIPGWFSADRTKFRILIQPVDGRIIQVSGEINGSSIPVKAQFEYQESFGWEKILLKHLSSYNNPHEMILEYCGLLDFSE